MEKTGEAAQRRGLWGTSQWTKKDERRQEKERKREKGRDKGG